MPTVRSPPAGTALRQSIEDRTDALALAPWAALGAEACDELRGLVRPLSRAVIDNGGLPGTGGRAS